MDLTLCAVEIPSGGGGAGSEQLRPTLAVPRGSGEPYVVAACLGTDKFAGAVILVRFPVPIVDGVCAGCPRLRSVVAGPGVCAERDVPAAGVVGREVVRPGVDEAPPNLAFCEYPKLLVLRPRKEYRLQARTLRASFSCSFASISASTRSSTL